MADRHRQTAVATPTAPVGSRDVKDARTRFELARSAREAGPQRVNIKGEDGVVAISEEDLRKLGPAATPAALPFLDFMESLYLGEIDFAREPVRCRETDL